MSTTGLRIQVLGAYARLLRSQRKAFQKDYKTREKALEQSRTGMVFAQRVDVGGIGTTYNSPRT